MLRAYRALTLAATPAAPLLLNFRQRRGKEEQSRLAERLGRASLPRPPGRLVWAHAASVGETNAILPLLSGLRARRPDVQILVTTGTVTSAALAQSRLGDGALHQYVPLDFPAFVTRFLDHWRPDAALFAESEIWPNLIMSAGARRIPLVLINARLSEQSFRRWRGRPEPSRALFSQFDLVLAQNEALVERFAELGARHCVAAGNLKIDAPPLPADGIELTALRAVIAERPVFLAASTHPGEDQHVVAAHSRLAAAHPGLLTIIVPRHPERGEAVETLVRNADLRPARRALGQAPDSDVDIYVADTIGELGLAYALAPVAFIGGSLVRHGGQNPIEAIKHVTAVITGPHYHNFEDAYAALLTERACLRIESGDQLATLAGELMGDELARTVMQGRAQGVIATLGGALDRTLDALQPLLPPQEGAGAR